MDTDCGIIPTPKFDEKQEDYHTSLSTSWMTLLCVPATNSNLEITYRLGIENNSNFASQYRSIESTVDAELKKLQN